MVNFEPKVNGRQPHRSPIAGFAGQAASVAGDALELAELQAKLARADALLAAKRVTTPIACLLIAACVALASLTILILGMASAVEALANLARWQAQLAVSLPMAVAAVVTMSLAVRSIRRGATQFERSANEFAKNLAWVKAMLGKTTASDAEPVSSR